MAEDDGRTEGWVFQNIEERQMEIIYLDNGFQQALQRVQIEEARLIPEEVEVEEDTSIRIFLGIGSTR